MSTIRPLAITNATVITGNGLDVIDKASILVSPAGIKAVIAGNEASLSPDYAVIDAGGSTVLPGLINAHAHGCAAGPSMPSGSLPLTADEINYQRNRHLLSGTTTLLNVCGLALPDEIDPLPANPHPLDVHISTGHTPSSLAAAIAADGNGLAARHLSATIDDMLACGAKALGEAGGGQTLGGGAQDYRFLPDAIEKACGLVIHPKLARDLKEAVLGRTLQVGADIDRPTLERLFQAFDLGRHLTIEALARLIRDTVMPPVALARQGLVEMAREAERTGMPAIFHNAAPTADQLIHLARNHPKARLIAGHSNHPSFTRQEALKTARLLRGLGTSIDVSTLDCVSTRWRNGPANLDALVDAGLVDTLSTDFAGGDWDGLLETIQRIIRKRQLTQAAAVAKATGNVARIFPELAGDRGLIEKGKRADLVISQSHNLGRVRHVIVAGRIVVFNGGLVSCAQDPLQASSPPG